MTFQQELSTAIRHLDLLNGDYPHPTIPSVANRLRHIRETMNPNSKAIAALEDLRDCYPLIVSPRSVASKARMKLRKDIETKIDMLRLLVEYDNICQQ